MQTKVQHKRLTHVASEMAPFTVAVVDVAGRWMPVGAGELVTTALAVKVS
jgi:hypothetical protein